jgi:D-alanyl-D-alanine carboxypeptidase (penicillin-binding protein 5/6)
MIGFLPLIMWPGAALSSVHSSPLPPLEINALSGAIVDERTGKVLWQKDAHRPMYPASTTKIMTGLLLLEKTQPTDIITAPPGIENVEPSVMHLKSGEQLTAHDLLYGMMLRSANDACVATAVHVAGSVPAFAEMMNARAKEIGCSDTTFHNPNGLNDTAHRTTAYDLALIAREAMKRPDFRAVVRTPKYKITRSINQKDLWMVNKNKWLKKDSTADGIKTGFTTPAGQCYVGSATRQGFRVIDTLLKSKTWQSDHGSMLDWAFKNYRKLDLFQPGDVVGDIAVEGGETRLVPAVVTTSEYVLVRPGREAITKELEPIGELKTPIKRKQRVGYMKITDEDGFTYRFPVFAEKEIPAAAMVSKMTSANPAMWVFGAALAGGWMVLRGRTRNRLRRMTIGQTYRYK